jgi:nucleoid DNA-binding protein
LAGQTVTKKDIVKSIAADADLTQLKVKEIVQRTFDEIIATLMRDGKIELRNFGVFKVTKRAARPARNPRTSEPVNVPAKCVVTFKPGKEMAERIRQLIDVPFNPDPAASSTGSSEISSPTQPAASTKFTPLPTGLAHSQVQPISPPGVPSDSPAIEIEPTQSHLTGE